MTESRSHKYLSAPSGRQRINTFDLVLVNFSNTISWHRKEQVYILYIHIYFASYSHMCYLCFAKK